MSLINKKVDKRKGFNFQPLVYLFVLVNLIIAAFIFPQYGQSTDEFLEEQRASVALKAYTFQNWDQVKEEYNSLGVVRYYGTAVTSAAYFLAGELAPLLDLPQADIVHYFYFVTFQIAVLAIYALARLFIQDIYAFIITLLFGTQPLYFGHAFINPKDIPMMAFFLLAVSVGFRAVQKIGALVQPEAGFGRLFRQTVSEDWHSLNRKRQRSLKGLGVCWLLLPGLVWGAHRFVSWFIQRSYNASEGSPLNRWFSAYASQQEVLDVQAYIQKGVALADQVFEWIAIGLLLVSILLLTIWFIRTRKWLWDTMAAAYLQMAEGRKMVLWAAFAAGAVWGIAVSARVLSVFAGGIVGLYMLLRLREKAFFPAVVYLLSAHLFAFLSWPYVWFYGYKGFIQAFSVFKDFNWNGVVLFRGQIYSGYDLPHTYLLELIPLQFTEPLVILSIIGFGVVLYWMVKKKLRWEAGGILIAWFLLPLLYSVISQPLHYSNFRQYLFITPPLFILAGITLQAMFAKVRQKAWLLVAAVVVLLPGVLALFTYHPYQYIYYNQFIGGLPGAAGTYEMDYWNTSYRAGMQYLNQTAPEDAQVVVWRVDYIAKYYARPDIEILDQADIAGTSLKDYDYGMLTNVLNLAENNLLEERVIYTVEVQNVPLLYIMDYSD